MNLKLGQIVVLFDPTTINKITKFFRNTKSTSVKDVERFIINLMNDQTIEMKDVSLNPNSEKS